MNWHWGRRAGSGVKVVDVDPERGLENDLVVASARAHSCAGRAEVEAKASSSAGPGFGFLSSETLLFMNGTVREVLRGGVSFRVASKDLVPGDIVANLSAWGKYADHPWPTTNCLLAVKNLIKNLNKWMTMLSLKRLSSCPTSNVLTW